MIRRLTALIFVATIVGNIFAGIQPIQPVVESNEVVRVLDNGRRKIIAASPTLQRESEQTVTVSAIAEEGSGWFYPEMLIVYNAETKVSSGYMGASKASVSVPVGTYDVLCSFSDDEYKMYYIIREEVEIGEDMTLTFNPEEATEQIKYRSYSPEGELWDVQLFASKFEPDVFVAEGTALRMCITNVLYNEEVGYICGFITDFEFNYAMNSGINELTDFYVNPLSDRYTLAQARIQLSNDRNVYINRFAAYGTDIKEISNDPDNYTPYSEKFALSPIENSQYYGGGFGVTTFFDGKMDSRSDTVDGDIQIESADSPVTLYIDNPYVGGDKEFNLSVLSSLSNFIVEGGVAYSWPIVGVPTLISGDYRQYLFSGEGYRWLGVYAEQENMEKMIFNPGHPLLGFDSNQKTGLFGDNVPVLDYSYASQDMGGQSYYYTIVPKYIGRHGEDMRPQLEAMNVDMKFNGETQLWSNYDELTEEFPMDWYREAKGKGNWEITLTTDNAYVDGINGKNKTVIKYDENKEDMWSPKLRIVQPRDVNGYMNNEFTTASEGKIYFVATDIMYENSLFYCIRPAVLEVSYSPTGVGEWETLNYEELPEYAYSNFGYTYVVDLSQVEKVSDNGWYDLRFNIIDEVGNSQEQILGPVFKIGESSSIESVAGDCTGVDVYDEVGIFVGNFKNIGSAKLDKGIYIVRNVSTGTSRKIIVK